MKNIKILYLLQCTYNLTSWIRGLAEFRSFWKLLVAHRTQRVVDHLEVIVFTRRLQNPKKTSTILLDLHHYVTIMNKECLFIILKNKSFFNCFYRVLPNVELRSFGLLSQNRKALHTIIMLSNMIQLFTNNNYKLLSNKFVV